MTATLFLPAHPSYFEEAEYSQAEIERAIEHLDRRRSGRIFGGGTSAKWRIEYRLVREPGKEEGKNLTVIMDSTGHPDRGDERPIEQFRRTMLANLQADITTLKSMLHRLRQR